MESKPAWRFAPDGMGAKQKWNDRKNGSRDDDQQQLPTLGDKSFESIKQTNDHGTEYRGACDLQILLGYSQWRRFELAIERAITSCEQSGNVPADRG